MHNHDVEAGALVSKKSGCNNNGNQVSRVMFSTKAHGFKHVKKEEKLCSSG